MQLPNPPHHEPHFIHRIGWMRAAVLGANDGIVSTASLLVGVASASAGRMEILLAGIAGLVAGAMSMAAGEYVSVSSQADTERADLKTEAKALKAMPGEELAELAAIYESRGVSPKTARAVAEELMAENALEAHARDELGISDVAKANPVQAAFSSAASFTVGAALPVLAAFLAPAAHTGTAIVAASLASLAALGMASAQLGGARKIRAVGRIVLWGAGAMAVTALVGRLFGVVV
ncbi:VIT1/CCC1 transporter family protein [Henriciella aquimarina]|uniref:VIT1/CCC1 transporter family protein n=1 Tax=Henriciella aquimarina TaxID=545261 RepID=UPI00117B37F4|nr:VIT family protein [Henriciella aquimarina]